jgi:hypothetical protein
VGQRFQGVHTTSGQNEANYLLRRLECIAPRDWFVYFSLKLIFNYFTDLANPKTNANKTAGFTDQERNDFSELLDAGFIDTFRHLHPEQTGAYTFWSTMHNARATNTGWCVL